MRVLLSSYVCVPGRGSEPGVGWAFTKAAAAAHDVTLLTLPENEEAILAALEKEGLRPVTIVPVPSPRALRRFEGRMGAGHLDYLIWQYRAWRGARALRDRVDVAHHVTFGNDWLPCALMFMPGVPVVWGPVGGTAPLPWRLIRYLSPRGLVRELARELIMWSVRSVTTRLVRRQGCVVVAVNKHPAERFERLGLPVYVEPHVAMPPVPPGSGSGPVRSRPGQHRAVFAARLESWKGPFLALQALAELPPDWQLDMFGDGPEAAGLHRRAARLGVSDRVRFLGNRPLPELRQALEEADALLFPSMHDASPYTVAEAVRLGCPVVCLDVGGPPLLIEGTSGAAVPADGNAPSALAAALQKVSHGPPSDRWNGERLAATVDEWYIRAVGDAAAPVERGL